MSKDKPMRNINEIQEELDAFAMKCGSHKDSIDEQLYKENKEIIQLNYDRASKMMAIGSSSFIGSAALMVAFIGKSLLGFWFFLIMTLISLPRTGYRNVRTNKCFNTLTKKIKNG